VELHNGTSMLTSGLGSYDPSAIAKAALFAADLVLEPARAVRCA
jgi:hypothetical protein